MRQQRDKLPLLPHFRKRVPTLAALFRGRDASIGESESQEILGSDESRAPFLRETPKAVRSAIS